MNTGSHTQAPRRAQPSEEVERQMFWVSCSMLPQLVEFVAVVCLSRAHVKDRSLADGKPSPRLRLSSYTEIWQIRDFLKHSDLDSPRKTPKSPCP